MRDTERMARKLLGTNPANLSRDGQRNLELAQHELFCRIQAEGQFHKTSVDERVAQRRLREQQQRRATLAANNKAFLKLAAEKNLG